jgi:hypothetical protein
MYKKQTLPLTFITLKHSLNEGHTRMSFQGGCHCGLGIDGVCLGIIAPACLVPCTCTRAYK